MVAITKISALPAGVALAGPEIFPGVQGGADAKFTATQLRTFAVAGLAVGLFNALSSVSVPAAVAVIRTSGYSVSGIGGDVYTRVGAGPATAWRTQDALGAWWQLANPEPLVDALGALGDWNGTTGTDDLSAFTASLAYNSRIKMRAGASYKVTDTIDGSLKASMHVSGGAYAAGPGNETGFSPGEASSIVLTTNNRPIIKVGGVVTGHDFTGWYATDQTTANTASIGMSFYNMSGFWLKNVKMERGYINFGIAQTPVLPVGSPTFNWAFNGFAIGCNSYKAAWAHFDWRAYGPAGGTNISMLNCMLDGGWGQNWSIGSGPVCAHAILARQLGGLHIDNISIESMVCNDTLVSLDSTAFSCGSFRTESLQFNGDATNHDAIYFDVIGGSNHLCLWDVRTLEISNNRIRVADGVTGGNSCIIRATADAYELSLGGAYFSNDCAITLTSGNLVFLIVGGNGSLQSKVEIGPIMNYTAATSGNGIVLNDFKEQNDTDVVKVFNGKTIFDDFKSNNIAGTCRHYYYTYGWKAPGGAFYNAAKVWQANSYIHIIDALTNAPLVYFKAAAGAAAAGAWSVLEILALPTTVSALPSAATVPYMRTSVTDANTALTAGIGTTVVGGGANKVPVWSDGTNWKIA